MILSGLRLLAVAKLGQGSFTCKDAAHCLQYFIEQKLDQASLFDYGFGLNGPIEEHLLEWFRPKGLYVSGIAF